MPFIFMGICSLTPKACTAQIDTLFKYNTNQRLFNLWKTWENRLFTFPDSAYVYNTLDTLEQGAKKQDDQRMEWYCKYLKLIYNGGKQHDLHGKIINMYGISDWVKNCPFEVIQASYKHTLGELLIEDKKTAEAFNFLLQAQHAFEKIGFDNIPEIFEYLDELASVYYKFQDYQNAIKYTKLAEPYPACFNNIRISNLNTEALAYNRLNDLDNAALYFAKTMNMAKQTGDTAWVGIASGNYGYLLMTQGNYKQAIAYLTDNYTINCNRIPGDAALAALNLANCYTKTGNTLLTKFYLQQAEKLKSLDYDPLFSITYYKSLYQYCANTGNIALAYSYADSVIVLTDSINTLKGKNLITSTEKRIETENYLSGLALAEEQEKNKLVIKYIVVIAISVILFVILLLVYSRYRSVAKDKKLAVQQQLILNIEKKAVQEKLHHSENELTAYIKSISEKNMLIEKVNMELKHLQEKNNFSVQDGKIEKLAELMESTILTEDEWKRFKQLFDEVHPRFFVALKERFPGLSQAETRLLALVKLKISQKEMAFMIGVSTATVTKTKYRLRKKLATMGIDNEVEQFVDGL